MAHFVDGGNLSFKSLMYGQANPNTMQFVQQQMEHATQALTTSGQRFMDWGRQLYSYLDSSETMRALKAAGRALRSMWDIDDIRLLTDIGHFQHAQPKMQRWIMAEPTLRSYFVDQRVDGYSDTYVDVDPGNVGEAHYDWRRVMDGMVVIDSEPNEEGEYGWTATNYIDELLDEDVPLELDQQVDILHTWEHLRALLREGKEDPTSRFNADLG